MTGQADVRWIWMAVALVVVAVPVLTVLFNREVRALQQRVHDLEGRLGALAHRKEPPKEPPTDPPMEPPTDPPKEPPTTEPRRAEADPPKEDPRLLDVMRTLSALRPSEPEFVEEYYVEAGRD